MTSDEIKKLKIRVNSLEDEVRQLRRIIFNDSIGNLPDLKSTEIEPFVPDFPFHEKSPQITCSLCKMEFSGMVGYSCNLMNCPVQPKITC
jgi:hypothetical protein